MADPIYEEIISREAVEAAAALPDDDPLGVLAREMLSAVDEEVVFRRAAKGYMANIDQAKRRFAIAALAQTFGVTNRAEFKRLLRFWGIVNEFD